MYGFDIGYQWNRLFSAELGYLRLSSMNYYVPLGVIIQDGNLMRIRSRYVAYVALKFVYPIIQNLYVTAKLGAAYLDNEVTFSFIPVSGLPQKADYWAPVFAFGLQYYFNWDWSINAQYMFLPGYPRRPLDGIFRKIPVPHANIVTVGVGYKFAV
ncbi:outer membrane beta-barrel protein [Candidiatus Paracoxiella cheracis]|uniref:outer membrane beta-barrel protein n=1 Tax=Candidiatus Paracoxiella cheracis TaxID=3405120 RepID=UPI003BF4F915